MRGRSFAKASTSPATYSAIGSSKTPRALVTTVGEAASSGQSSRSTPALAVCTQRGRGPSPGQAARTASEVKSQTSRTSASGSCPASVLPSAYLMTARPVSRPRRGDGSVSSTRITGVLIRNDHARTGAHARQQDPSACGRNRWSNRLRATARGHKGNNCPRQGERWRECRHDFRTHGKDGHDDRRTSLPGPCRGGRLPADRGHARQRHQGAALPHRHRRGRPQAGEPPRGGHTRPPERRCRGAAAGRGRIPGLLYT